MKSEPNPVSFRVFLQHPNSKQQSSLHHRIPTYNELLNSSLKGSDVFLSYSCRVGVASLNDFCFLYKRKASPKPNLSTFLQSRTLSNIYCDSEGIAVGQTRFHSEFYCFRMRSFLNVCFCF